MIPGTKFKRPKPLHFELVEMVLPSGRPGFGLLLNGQFSRGYANTHFTKATATRKAETYVAQVRDQTRECATLTVKI